MTFPKFQKIPRWSNDTFYITEKIDGTNGLIFIESASVPATVDEPAVAYVDGHFIYAGSRKRWISLEDDNFGFATWVRENAQEIAKLGPGHHYGEWYGSGIQRGYGLQNGAKRFALFNVGRWLTDLPTDVVETVPLLAVSGAEELPAFIDTIIQGLRENGSAVRRGFDRPEGVIIYSKLTGQYWKRLVDNDDVPKSVTLAEVLDRRGDGEISRDELVAGFEKVWNGSELVAA